LSTYYTLRTNNYGGAAYGFRWHLVSMPVLLLMGIPVWNGVRTPLRWCLALALLGVSMYSAWECYTTPWGANQEWTCRLLFGPSY